MAMATITSRPAEGLDYRYERKYHAAGVSPDQIDVLIRTHPAHFVEPYPPRWINNVYLDTPGLGTFSVHVNGAARRRKVRIRWYGEAHGPTHRPVLEVKLRSGTVGSKLHYSLPGFVFEPDFRIPLDALRAAHAQLDPHARALLDATEPALFNRYHRRYWCTADGRYRLTVDTQMSFHTVNDRAWGPIREWHERRLTILELKYDPNDDAEAGSIAAALPYPLGKYSKYVYGIERLSGLRG